MGLSERQLAGYRRDGFVLLPAFFNADEIAVLSDDLPRIFALEREEVRRDPDGTAHTALALERYSEPFSRLLRHPRIIAVAEQVLGGGVYAHQYKVISKAPFSRLQVPWHTDFGTWVENDGMRAPQAMNVTVLLDDITEFNGPIVFVPGSHADGHIPELTVRPTVKTMEVDDIQAARIASAQRKVANLAERFGLAAPKGKAGDVLLFHPCLAHGSAANISPRPRRLVYLSLNHVGNRPRDFTRESFYANRDLTPLEPLAADCLSTLAHDVNGAATCQSRGEESVAANRRRVTPIWRA